MALKGERLGRYTLDRRLARTAEGEVWKARAPGEVVAALRLFYAPAWAELLRAAGPPQPLEHPQLARFLGAAPTTRPPLLAWSFIEGSSLRAMLEEQPYVPLGAAIPFVLQIARGLEAMHTAKAAHLDLRPGNVLIDGAQSPAYRRGVITRLFSPRTRLDAREREHKERLAPYLAPELVGGRPERPGPETDMYAFGMLVYRLLTGTMPTPIDPRFPSTFDKRIPKVFDEVVIACIERRVRARRPDAIGLTRELYDGLSRAGFSLDLSRAPLEWVQATPWRDRPADAGSATGAFQRLFGRLGRRRS